MTIFLLTTVSYRYMDLIITFDLKKTSASLVWQVRVSCDLVRCIGHIILYGK